MYISSASPSSLELYFWCQWKYFLQYQLGFEDVSGPAAVLGHIAHKILEILARASKIQHYPESKVWNLNWLFEKTYNHYYKKNPIVCQSIKPDKLKKVSEGLQLLIAGEYSPIRNNVVATEIRFSIPMESPEFAISTDKTGKVKYLKLNGVIDRIDKINDDTIEIIDYKSGTSIDYNDKNRKQKDVESIYNMIQSKIYHFASKRLFPWAKNVIVTFIYFADGGAIQVPFDDNDIKITQDHISKRFRAIRANTDPQRIKPHWKCNMCPFSKDGVCDGVWSEKEEFGIEFVENKYRVLNNKLYDSSSRRK